MDALINDWQSFKRLGIALYNSKQYELAIDAFQKSLALNQHWATYNGLGWTLHNSKQYEPAIDAFKQSLALNKNCQSYQGLGWSLYNLKQYEQATGAFRQSLAITKSSQAHEGLGWSLYKLKQYKPAIDAFKQSLSQRKNWEVYRALGVALYNSAQYESAIDAFRQSLAITKSSQAHEGLGWALYNLKQYESAINEFKQSLALNKHWKSYQGLGWALHDSKQYQPAIEAFTQSLALNKTQQSYQGLGLTFCKLGKIDKGTEAMRKFYTFSPPLVAIDPYAGSTVPRTIATQDLIENINEKLIKHKFAFHPSFLQREKDPNLQPWENLIHIHIPKCAGTNFEKPLTNLRYYLPVDPTNDSLYESQNPKNRSYLWHGNLDGRCTHDAFILEAFNENKTDKIRGSFLTTHGAKHSIYSQKLQEAGAIAKKVCLVRDPSLRLYSHIRELGREKHTRDDLLQQGIEDLSNVMDRYIYDYNLFQNQHESPYCKPTDYENCESIEFIDVSDDYLISKVKSSLLSATSMPNIVQFNRFYNDKDKPSSCSSLTDKDFKEVHEELIQRGYLERDNLIDLDYLKNRTKERITFPSITNTGTELHPITFIFLQSGETKKVLTKELIANPLSFIN